MLKFIVSFLLSFCQLFQLIFVPLLPDNNDVEYTSIKTAVITGEYALGDTDPQITIELDNTSVSDKVNADMFELTELFSSLDITEVSHSETTITLFTKGTIPFAIPLTGGVDISADATEADTELRAECDLIIRNAYIKQDSFILSDNVLSFDVICLNGTFTFVAGDIIESNGLTFTVKSVSEDGSAMTLSIKTSAEDLDIAIAQIDGKEIHIPADKLSSDTEQTVLIYANEASLCAKLDSIRKTQTADTYTASASLFVKNGTWAENLTVTDIILGGAFEDATITALTKTKNTYIVEFTFSKSNINLNKVTLEGSLTVKEGRIKNLWNTTLPQCSVSLNYIKHGLTLDGYKEITAYIPADTGVFGKISNLSGYISTVSGIVNGVTSVLGILGIIETTDAKIDNTREIVRDVQQAVAALNKKLDNMGTEMTTGTIETLNNVQYNTYITASGNWDHFISSYIVPLQNEINEFKMAYNDYMLNYIMNAHSLLHTVTV